MRKFVAAVVVAAVGITVGVAWSSIPDGSGVIHSCYKTSGAYKGQVRIIDSGSESCETAETALNWQSGGITSVSVVTATSGTFSGNTSNGVEATCSSGTLIGGGFDLLTGNSNFWHVTTSRIDPGDPTSWDVEGHYGDSSSWSLKAYAICAE